MRIPYSILGPIAIISLAGNLFLGWVVINNNPKTGKTLQNVALSPLPEERVEIKPLVADTEDADAMEVGPFRMQLGEGFKKSKQMENTQVGEESPLKTFAPNAPLIGAGVIGTYRLQEEKSGAETLAWVFQKEKNESLQAWFERIKPAYKTERGEKEGEPQAMRVINGRSWLQLSNGAFATSEENLVLIVFLHTYPVIAQDAALGLQDQILASLTVTE